jgi:hypothetical protein
MQSASREKKVSDEETEKASEGGGAVNTLPLGRHFFGGAKLTAPPTTKAHREAVYNTRRLPFVSLKTQPNFPTQTIPLAPNDQDSFSIPSRH